MRTVIDRRLIAELLDWQVGLHFAAMLDDEAQGVRRLADHREIQTPLAEDGFGLLLLCGRQHHEHALLAFRQHHFVGGHAGFAAGHLVEIEFDAEVALCAHFYRRRGQACRAHVLNGDDGAALHQFEAGFEQKLFRKGVADLHRRAFFLGVGLEGGRRHGCAVDTVAAGLGAEIDDGVPDAGGLGVEDLVRLGEADRHGVDQNVAVIGFVESGGAADRRHAEGIAVAADASNHAADEMAGLGVRGRTEAEQVQAGDRPRAHGEDVAEDAADTGRRALIGFDEGWVVVALHLENAGLAVADVDDAGVLARTLDHPGRTSRQLAQVHARRLVGTMLVPHGRENAELGEARRASDQLQDTLVFIRLEPVRRDQFGRDIWFCRQGNLTRRLECEQAETA